MKRTDKPQRETSGKRIEGEKQQEPDGRARDDKLRVLLYGPKMSGKSSVMNIVFGKDLLAMNERTVYCKSSQGNVQGRELMLVDTPGWWKDFPLSDTATFLKNELVYGVSLCKPGPHAILLVIDVGLEFNERHRKSVEEHLSLLGDNIWAHVLVLFTKGHSTGARTPEAEEYIGEALQWVIEKCGRRFHFFDITVPHDVSQVCLLLGKIEDLLRKNSAACFEIDPKTLQESEEWRESVKKRARDRQLGVQEQLKKSNKEELRIMLVGWMMSGKSASGNMILNKEVFAVTGKSTAKCQIGHGEVSGRPVTVIDTPSWWKYFPPQYTPDWIKSEILDGAFQKHNTPHAVLLVIPADTSFREEQRNVIEENMKLLGEQVWRHTIILFTSGDMLGDMTVEQHIESEGEDLQVLVEKCGNRYHVFDNEKKDSHAQVKELLEKIDEMVFRNFTLFHLSAENKEVKERDGQMDTQSKDLSDDKGDVKEVVLLIDEEWKRRDKEFLEKVLQLSKDYLRGAHVRGDRSIDLPENFRMTQPDTDRKFTNGNQGNASDTESVSNRHGDPKEEEKHSLKLKDQFKEMFDREWSRREETLLGTLQEMLKDRKCETGSIPDQDELECSRQKVLKWFDVSTPSGYASASENYAQYNQKLSN